MTAEFETLLPSNVSPAMLAVEETSGERWGDVDVDVIRRFKDPWRCPAHLLNFLAYERSVDLWDEKWPEWKKRSVIASAPQDHRLKGTLAGIARYVEIAGGRIVQHLVPPQGYFASEDLTKEQWDAWIDRMPRVRITLAHREGEWALPHGFFAGVAAASDDFVKINDGHLLHGRRALYRANADADDVDLEVGTLDTVSSDRDAVDFERIAVPGVDANGTIAGQAAAGDAFAGATDKAPKIFTYALDRSYRHEASELALSMVPVGLDPQSVRYKRESDIGDAEHRIFAGDGAASVDFAGRNDGGELLADVLYLLDPTVAAPLVDAISFAGVTRVSMPAYNAELMIEAPRELRRGDAFIAGETFAAEAPTTPDDVSHLHLLLDAVAMSKAFRDKVLVTFETTKPLTLGDAVRLNSGARLGDRVPAHL